jgi:DNA (cytosine-5)-methyltransferase 1
VREIIVDNFAGGGGASTGIELAVAALILLSTTTERRGDAHTNHPDTLHYCESVYEVRPKVAPLAVRWRWHGFLLIAATFQS